MGRFSIKGNMFQRILRTRDLRLSKINSIILQSHFELFECKASFIVFSWCQQSGNYQNIWYRMLLFRGHNSLFAHVVACNSSADQNNTKQKVDIVPLQVNQTTVSPHPLQERQGSLPCRTPSLGLTGRQWTPFMWLLCPWERTGVTSGGFMCHCPWPEKIKQAHMFLKFQANASSLPNTKPRGYKRAENPNSDRPVAVPPTTQSLGSSQPRTNSKILELEIIGALWSLLGSEAKEWRQNVSINQISLAHSLSLSTIWLSSWIL